MTILPLLAALLLPAQAAVPDYDDAASRARKLLEGLVRADTTNLPGNEARAARLAEKRLKADGIPYEITQFAPGRENITARLKGTGEKRPLLLLAHTDVVGAEGQAWTFPPHEVTEKDGFLYGRGVNDDLGMAAVALEVFTLLKRSGTKLKRDLILAWTGDEESGGAGIQMILEKNPEAVACEVALNEGGGLVLGKDGKVKLANLQTGEKIYHDFELTAQGPTGHSSVPLKENAIYRLASALDKLGRYREPARLHPVVRAYFAGRASQEAEPLSGALKALAAAPGDLPKDPLAVVEAEPSLSALLRTTCVATMLSGGTRANALPAEAKATINCRILPDETPDQAQARLTAILDDPSVKISSLEIGGESPASPLEGPGPRAIEKVVAGMFPGAPVIPVLSRGASDSRFLRKAGIAAYGFSPLPISEEDSRRAHGIDERIPSSSLRVGVEVLHRLILELDTH